MSTLELLGLASLAFCVVFTWWTWRRGASPLAAIIEAWANIVYGFALNWALNWILIPLMSHGAHITGVDNWWGGWAYTAASMVRQYSIRMYLGERLHDAAVLLAEKKLWQQVAGFFKR